MVKAITHRWIHLFGIVLGVVSLIYLLIHVNLSEVLTVASRMKWQLLIILSLTIPKYYLYSVSWQKILRHLRHDVSIATLFRVKLIGEAVSEATPLNVVGGDSSRMALLTPVLPFKEAGLSIVLDRLSHVLSGVVVMLLGAIGFLMVRPDLWDRRWDLPVLVMTAVVLGSAVVVKKKWASSSRAHHPVVLRGVVWTALGRLLSVVEIYLIGVFIGVPLNLTHALILNGLSLGLSTLFAFVPSGIGVLEGGFAGYFALMGWSPEAGLAVELVRRANGFFWILCGGIASLISRPLNSSNKQC
jgi:uncharacterized membrane protein YbhN (UPF0104 family)